MWLEDLVAVVVGYKSLIGYEFRVPDWLSQLRNFCRPSIELGTASMIHETGKHCGLMGFGTVLHNGWTHQWTRMALDSFHNLLATTRPLKWSPTTKLSGASCCGNRQRRQHSSSIRTEYNEFNNQIDTLWNRRRQRTSKWERENETLYRLTEQLLDDCEQFGNQKEIWSRSRKRRRVELCCPMIST